MKRYEFADALLQFLNAIAWVCGAMALLGAVLWIGKGQAEVGIIFGVAGIISVVTLLAVGHVGRAVIDIAIHTQALYQRSLQGEPVRSEPPVNSSLSPQPARTCPTYDSTKWRFLKELDPEIGAAATRVAEMGLNYEDLLAERFMALDDRSYLPAIEAFLVSRSADERSRQEALTESAPDPTTEDARVNVDRYAAAVQANGGKDPGTSRKVIRFEPYFGNWKSFRGGVKMQLDAGDYVLTSGTYWRYFAQDPDAPAEPRARDLPRIGSPASENS